jgi:DNA-directed RNA polymerase subunit RPC12/RpoP
MREKISEASQRQIRYYTLINEQFFQRYGWAHSIFGRCRKEGLIEYPSACDICHRNDKRIVGYHEDYMNPIDILWVCNRCHRLIHTEKIRIGLKRYQMILDNRYTIMKRLSILLKESKSNQEIYERLMRLIVNKIAIMQVVNNGSSEYTCHVCLHSWSGDLGKTCPNCGWRIVAKSPFRYH